RRTARPPAGHDRRETGWRTVPRIHRLPLPRPGAQHGDRDGSPRSPCPTRYVKHHFLESVSPHPRTTTLGRHPVTKRTDSYTAPATPHSRPSPGNAAVRLVHRCDPWVMSLCGHTWRTVLAPNSGMREPHDRLHDPGSTRELTEWPTIFSEIPLSANKFETIRK